MSRALVWALLILHASLASGAQFGSWVTGRADDGTFFAATGNDSGALLGNYCAEGGESCLWQLGLNQACDPGSKNQLLVNADTGSTVIEVFCHGLAPTGKYRLIFSEYDKIDSVVKEASHLGFAIPLADGKFAVVRFGLIGSNQAIDDMVKSVKRASKSETAKPPRGTKDYEM
jgi:hypothetical protein